MTIGQSVCRRPAALTALVATLAFAPLALPAGALLANERPQFADLIESNRPAVVNIRTAFTVASDRPRAWPNSGPPRASGRSGVGARRFE